MDVGGFQDLRPYLFSVAYRMLGRATEKPRMSAGRVGALWVFSIVDGAIAAIHAVRNPDKLRYFKGQLTYGDAE